MAEQRIVRSLGVERPGVMAFFGECEEPLRDRQFRVDTLYSGLSAGTELTTFKGTNPFLHAGWDPELGTFVEGEAETSFPVRRLGYMEVGRVRESRADGVTGGSVLAMTYGHQTAYTADALQDFFVPLPPDMDPILGIYVGQMGPICANGLLHAAADLLGPDVPELGVGVRGRRVLVIGAGVVGLITALFALHHRAASVAVTDASTTRLAAVEALGALAIDERKTEVWRWCKEHWHHGPRDHGADVVFQCRARDTHLQMALRSLRPQGTVIDLAFYQDGAAAVRLGEEFHHNGLTIRCAQIARVPRGLVHDWDRERLARETIDLLRCHGDLVRHHIITDVVPLDEAPALVAALAAHQREPIQAVFRMAG